MASCTLHKGSKTLMWQPKVLGRWSLRFCSPKLLTPLYLDCVNVREVHRGFRKAVVILLAREGGLWEIKEPREAPGPKEKEACRFSYGEWWLFWVDTKGLDGFYAYSIGSLQLWRKRVAIHRRTPPRFKRLNLHTKKQSSTMDKKPLRLFFIRKLMTSSRVLM